MSQTPEEKPVHVEHHEHAHQEHGHTKVFSGVDEHLAAALARDNPNPFGPGYLKLYFFCFLIFFASTMNGFDGALMGSINALPNYTSYYHLPPKGNSATGIVFAIFNIGQMVGSLFIWLADWKGRKLPIFLGCIGVIVGTIITSTAPTLSVFVGGRFLLSFFSTIATTAAPVYMIEIAPPLYRGTIAGLYNTLWYMGSIIATCAVYGANMNLANDGNVNWRLPLWLQMVCPAIVVAGVWFCPESPRYLVGKGRAAEARAILVKFHANGDETHPLVDLQMQEMEAALQREGMLTWKNFLDVRSLFRTRGRAHRMLLNVAFSWFGQFSGNNIASYYLPKLLSNVGITTVNTQLELNIVYSVLGYVAAVSGSRFHDILGRRKMFLISISGMIICLAIAAGTAAGYVETGSTSASNASIAFIYLFGVSYSWAFTSMHPIYPGEVMANDMRAKGMCVSGMVSGIASFVNTFAAPVALNNIGYWFYAFFAFWDCFELVFVYFFFVETKGRTLEELEEIFNSPNPAKASIKLVSVRAGSDDSSRDEKV
ncbi:sugar transporter [Dacryopinax primogenitus]|uniref:Sugar transporter n=1 Tax=Dacryopinax primogenitus (strain DJM 731) TaxID=1858805 RepID=M5GGQ4_DACPD|nr:sugar transporter [Dacryopinax primogenitus]EJU05893.1 sugar transporter [Dacryopinax primogenitus]